MNDLSEDQRNKILVLTRTQYELLGCVFPFTDNRELVEYLNESLHGTEINCLNIAIEAHNLYNKDNLTINDFFDWHGL